MLVPLGPRNYKPSLWNSYVLCAFFDVSMDLDNENNQEDLENLSRSIPVLSGYSKALEVHVKRRYLQKISIVRVDLASIPSEEFDPECLPPIEAVNLQGYLVLETSYYTKQQFKAFKSLEAYNHMVSGFVTSVRGRIISGKYVVAKVRHSQRMNNPLVNIWIIAEDDGTILSAHCLGCKVGLAESCSHIASAMFYIKAWTRIHGKLACTQVKCTWLLPTYMNKVPYARVKDIDFTSAKKLKENLDNKIDSLDEHTTSPTVNSSQTHRQVAHPKANSPSGPSAEEMAVLFEKLNQCKIKPVALSLVGSYADQFVAKSRTVPVVTDLYATGNLGLKYPELLKKCLNVKIDL